MNKPKYQIFISSTYEDMKEERQAAMMAILNKKHIPAGMEYFSARYLDQFDVIREWIEKCDIFLLILGGRYGSICDKTNKSFVHMEFEYAQDLKMPIIVLQANDDYVNKKKGIAYKKGNKIYDNDRTDLYQKMIEGIRKMRKIYKSIPELQNEIIRAICDIEEDEKTVAMLNGLVPCYPEMKKNQDLLILSKDILKELLFYFLHSTVFYTYSEKTKTGRGYFLSDVAELSTGQFDYYNYEEVQVEYQRLNIWSHAVEEKRYIKYIADKQENSDVLKEIVEFRFQNLSDRFRFESRQTVKKNDKEHCVANVEEVAISYLGITVSTQIGGNRNIRENGGS